MSNRLPGLFLAVFIAFLAFGISTLIGGPQVLWALLMGIGISHWGRREVFKTGLDFAAFTVLKLGIILLGVRISLSDILEIGWGLLFGVTFVVFLSIVGAIAFAKAFQLSKAQGVLTAAAVSICGTSAAIAAHSLLQDTKENKNNLATTIIAVTLLSHIVMVLYPAIAKVLSLQDDAAGALIGLTVHNVAQAIGAGFIISDEAVASATIFKLIRISLLGPIIILFSLLMRFQNSESSQERKTPLIPGFIILFVIMVGINSYGVFSSTVSQMLNHGSEWALLASVAAIGVQTRLFDLKATGRSIFSVLTAQSIWLFSISLILIMAIY